MVTLTATGSDFTWAGLGRSYSTTTCWEQMPGLQTRSHSASPTTIRTTCEMPKGDPRQTKLVTTWALRGDKIYFDETAQYQFVGKEGVCTASARRTRLLSRAVSPAGSSADPPSALKEEPHPEHQAKEEPSRAAKSPACTGQEAPEVLTIVPHTSVLRGGDRLEFDLIVRGERGCPVRDRPHIEVTEGKELIEVGADGTFLVHPSASSGRVTLRAAAGAIDATASVMVVSQRELKTLLGDGEEPELDPNTLARTDATTSTEAQGESDSKGIGLLASLLAAAVLGCGAVLYWFRRRARPSDAPTGGSIPATSRAPADASGVDPGARTVAKPEAASAGHPAERVKGRVCPVCGERYPMETVFCGKEGARLVREN